MKRLCVFYYKGHLWIGKNNVEWIVCKKCQQSLRRGTTLWDQLCGDRKKVEKSA
jgi:hypothetical protein